jgi:hypothetical protein
MINLPDAKRVLSSELGAADVGAGGAPPRISNVVSQGGNIVVKPLGKNQKAAYDKAEQLEPGFKAKVAQVAKNIGVSETDLAKIMYKESGYIQNKPNSIGCIGLTQFCGDRVKGQKKLMPYKTIGGKKYQLSDIRALTRIQQLDIVEIYFKASGFSSSKPRNIGDLYVNNFYPVALNKSNDFILGSEDKANPNWKFLVQEQNPFPTSKTLDGRKILTRGDVYFYALKL